MNRLTVINQNGQLLVGSREVAEMVGKQHKELLRDIRNYSEILTSADLLSSNFFMDSTYEDAKGEIRPCYLLTRKGCDMVANKMTGEKGVLFTAAYVSQFEEMEKQLSNPFKYLSKELQAIIAVDQKVETLQMKIDEVDQKVETQITLTQGEQRALQKTISTKVYSIAEDSQYRSELYRELYREIKDRWGVPSYRDVLRKDLADVKRYVEAWKPKVTV